MFGSFILKIKSNKYIKRILDILLTVFLSLYIFSLPSFSSRSKYNLISYGLVFVLILLVALEYVFFVRFVFNKRLLILAFFAVESLVGTILYSHEFRHWLTIVLLFVTHFLLYYAFLAINKKRLIIILIACSIILFGVYFAFHYRGRIIKLSLGSPLGGFFDNVNAISTYFSIGSALCFYLVLTYKKRIDWLFIIPCVFLLFLGLFTGSRQYIITTGFTFVVVVFVCFRKKKWVAFLVVVVFAILFLLLLQLPFLSSLKERIVRGISTLFGIGNAKYDPSAVQRTVWPQYGFSLGSRVMLFGYGAEGFSIYSGIGTYSHNTYSEIFCNFGILGALIFFFSFLLPFVLTIKNEDKSVRLVFVIVAFYFVKGFFGVYFASKDAYLMIAFLLYLTKDIHFGEYLGIRKRGKFTPSFYREVSI